LQVHGGYGYSSEQLPEAWLRDQKLNSIHEGTTGIQALDLLGRKVVADGGEALRVFLELVEATIARADRAGVGPPWITPPPATHSRRSRNDRAPRRARHERRRRRHAPPRHGLPHDACDRGRRVALARTSRDRKGARPERFLRRQALRGPILARDRAPPRA